MFHAHPVFAGCLLTASMTLATTAQDPAPSFYQAAPNPILERSPPGSWDYAFNDPGAVLTHAGKLHMFNNGFDGWPTTSGIGYHVSDDGLTWKTMTAGPIFRSGDHTFEGFALVVTSACVTPSGEWRLYLTQLSTRSGTVLALGFRMLVADDPLGEWTLRDEMILAPGEAGAWDAKSISDPMVIRTKDGKYRMYYSGFDQEGISRIGLARSEDGVRWEKHAEPVLSPSLDWQRAVHYPSVVLTEGGYGMVYRSPTSGSSMRLGLAFSSDGLHWEKQAKPCYSPDSISGNSTSFITALVQHAGVYFLYVDAFVGVSFSQPYVLACEDELFEG